MSASCRKFSVNENKRRFVFARIFINGKYLSMSLYDCQPKSSLKIMKVSCWPRFRILGSEPIGENSNHSGHSIILGYILSDATRFKTLSDFVNIQDLFKFKILLIRQRVKEIVTNTFIGILTLAYALMLRMVLKCPFL